MLEKLRAATCIPGPFDGAVLLSLMEQTTQSS